jgi:mono/diheme cytochrome c family protein
MRRWMWLLMAPLLAQAADDAVSHGAIVFRQSCAVTYCHGPEGKAGRAPALAGRRFDAGTVIGIAATGIPNTSMPAFAGQLKPEDLKAVAAYVVSLNGSDAEGARSVAKLADMPPKVAQGRTLFFDAARTGACGSCHEIEGRGVPVSIALQDLRMANLSDLRAVETPNVVTAHPSGEEPFPAVVVEKGARRTRVYDLSSRLPVLRTFGPSDVVLAPGSSWSHGTASGLYAEAELAAILEYLYWLAGR